MYIHRHVLRLHYNISLTKCCSCTCTLYMHICVSWLIEHCKVYIHVQCIYTMYIHVHTCTLYIIHCVSITLRCLTLFFPFSSSRTDAFSLRVSVIGGGRIAGTHTRTHTHTHTHAHTHTHTHTRTCTHAHMHARAHTHVKTHAHSHTHCRRKGQNNTCVAVLYCSLRRGGRD